jgi:hypothetical protein
VAQALLGHALLFAVPVGAAMLLQGHVLMSLQAYA